MANRYFKQFPLVRHRRTIMLSGTITLNSSGAITASSLDFASVTKTATGEYTILLEDKYVTTKSIQLQHEGTALDQVKVKADTQSADKKIVINTLVSGSIANVATACKIHVFLTFKDSV